MNVERNKKARLFNYWEQGWNSYWSVDLTANWLVTTDLKGAEHTDVLILQWSHLINWIRVWKMPSRSRSRGNGISFWRSRSACRFGAVCHEQGHSSIICQITTTDLQISPGVVTVKLNWIAIGNEKTAGMGQRLRRQTKMSLRNGPSPALQPTLTLVPEGYGPRAKCRTANVGSDDGQHTWIIFAAAPQSQSL